MRFIQSGGLPFRTWNISLRFLKALLDQGLITQSDYDAKKAQILANV